MISTIVDLIRHGEPEGGTRYRGHTDDPLSETGWQQMRAAVADHNPWEVLVASPLLRCKEFAQEVASRHQLPLEEDARFKEIFFGPWEGKTGEQIIAEEDELRLKRFWSDPVNNMPAGAETMNDFEARVLSAWQEMLERHRGKHILLVGHGGMMRVIMAHALGMPLDNLFRLNVGYASISRIQIDSYPKGDFPRLKFHSGTL